VAVCPFARLYACPSDSEACTRERLGVGEVGADGLGSEGGRNNEIEKGRRRRRGRERGGERGSQRYKKREGGGEIAWNRLPTSDPRSQV
jgi:hypothetical protein